MCAAKSYLEQHIPSLNPLNSSYCRLTNTLNDYVCFQKALEAGGCVTAEMNEAIFEVRKAVEKLRSITAKTADTFKREGVVIQHEEHKSKKGI